MHLYYKPGACSLAPRIALNELALPFDAEKVDTASGRTETGEDYRLVNPKGYVPALRIEPGVVITENTAILQFLADRNPEAELAPMPGTLERVRLQEWLNFTGSELHKAFSPFFSGRKLTEEELQRANAQLHRRIGDVERALSDGRAFILGERFSVADAYLFVVLNWTGFLGIDLSPFPNVSAYVERVRQRPSVRAAMVQEGLAKADAA